MCLIEEVGHRLNKNKVLTCPVECLPCDAISVWKGKKKFIPTEDVIPANPNLELTSFSQDPVPLTDFLKELGEFIDIKLF